MNILAVEDNSAVAQFLALVLGGENCKVATACNGEKALTKIGAATRPFDVVITDHRMPCMSGLELVRQLRAKKFGGKVVVLSAYLTPSNRKAYEELGVDMMISKPYDVEELRQTIEVLTNSEPSAGGTGCNSRTAAGQSEPERQRVRLCLHENTSLGRFTYDDKHSCSSRLRAGRSRGNGTAKESAAEKANGQK